MERPKHQSPLTLFWFRRDLRLDDNRGFYTALAENQKVQPVFIFDTDILNELDNPQDRRVNFIHEYVGMLKNQLITFESDLWVFHGKPVEVFRKLADEHQVTAVYTNHDYEPYARLRDKQVDGLCASKGILFKTFKDQVIFEKNEVQKTDGTPYTVFTPYMRKWKENFSSNSLLLYNESTLLKNLHRSNGKVTVLPALSDIGFQPHPHGELLPEIPLKTIARYNHTRDLLALNGTSRLSTHLRFGTISIRKLAKLAFEHNEVYLNELIWREFYMQILWHFPQVVTQSFKSAYDQIPWNRSDSDFEKWSTAQTGYPIVDAAMKQLLTTGFMHNRARMIVASFLTKHLLVDWRKGEAFFAKHLNDYELSSNNGGWQWAASSGCDSVPYFRIFNPGLQAKRFDPEGLYQKYWNGENYNLWPMIPHEFARNRCLVTYKKVLNGLKWF